MPYITQDRRDEFDEYLPRIQPVTEGELNYCITRMTHRWLRERSGGTPSYGQYNAAIGVLECAKLELYRRRIAEYENKKATENGDVIF